MVQENQVARDMGLSRSTVHRMLATLSHHQFVEQDEHSRAYRPGPRWSTSAWRSCRDRYRAVSHTALVDLRDLTARPPTSASCAATRACCSWTASRVAGWCVPAPDPPILPRPRRPRQGPARGAHRRGDRRPVPVRAAGGAHAPGADSDPPTCSSRSPRSAAWATRPITGSERRRRRRRRRGPRQSRPRPLRPGATAPLSRADEAWVKKPAAAATMRVARELGDRVGRGSHPA